MKLFEHLDRFGNTALVEVSDEGDSLVLELFEKDWTSVLIGRPDVEKLHEALGKWLRETEVVYSG
jgi:hypothetical protein